MSNIEVKITDNIKLVNIVTSDNPVLSLINGSPVFSILTNSRTNIVIEKDGLQGPPGVGTTKQFETGEDIGVYSVVISVNGQIFKADPTNINHAGKVIGVSTQSVLQGEICNCVLLGEVSSGSWTSNNSYWVGLNGSLSSVPRAVGAKWFQRIGIAHSNDILIVDKGNPTLIED